MSAVRGPVVRFRFRGLSGRFDRGPSARFVSLTVCVSRGLSGGAQLACTIATNPEPDTTPESCPQNSKEGKRELDDDHVRTHAPGQGAFPS